MESTPVAGALSAISILGRQALRIVLPSWCIACDRELPWRERTASCCQRCWRSLPRITAPQCPTCALPLPAAGTCIDCAADPLPLEWCEAWGDYDGALERLLHAFKFERHDFLDRALAGLIEEKLRERGDLAFDAVIPVPMHRSKERRRGYNQAELLARAVAASLGIRGSTSLLAKTRDRATQSTLNRRERAANVRGAFQASAAARGLSILIIDDICTTGETLRACAKELLRHGGAARVCAAAVAKASE